MDTEEQLDTATIRALAVTASVDPKTILKVARGQKVRGMAGRRARRALVAAGFLQPTQTNAWKRTR